MNAEKTKKKNRETETECVKKNEMKWNFLNEMNMKYCDCNSTQHLSWSEKKITPVIRKCIACDGALLTVRYGTGSVNYSLMRFFNAITMQSHLVTYFHA